ncbi:MAG: redoxin domain-containing protein [Saprospiraceae bacterium]
MRFILFIFCLIIAQRATGSTGYDITVTIKNAPSDTLYFGYYYADKQFLRDTAIKKDGVYRFNKDHELEPGIYLLVMPPKNDFIQVFINKNEQNLQISVDAKETVKSFKVKGSKDNELFYDYLNFLEEARPKAQGLSTQLKETKDSAIQKNLQLQLSGINESVKNKQNNIVAKFPQSISAMLIKSTFETDIPEFSGKKEDIELQRYMYYKAHYFDQLDLGDSRMLRSPLLNERINYYLDKLTLQDPDSINVAMDYLLKKMQPAEESFKYYLIQFLNKYAASKIVGQDGVYVHLVDEYYSKGFAPWIDQEQLEKLEKNAASLRPILIGKTAPEIKVLKYPDQSPLSLHSIKSPYTILFIWDPECSHCKASLPIIVKFYEKYKTKGVEILAVCSQFGDKVPSCWKYLEEQKINPGWINAADPFHTSRYKILYDVKSTPQIFVLDKNKKIISKGIGAEQLSEVMDEILLHQP